MSKQRGRVFVYEVWGRYRYSGSSRSVELAACGSHKEAVHALQAGAMSGAWCCLEIREVEVQVERRGEA
jgi:hypothetical protein